MVDVDLRWEHKNCVSTKKKSRNILILPVIQSHRSKYQKKTPEKIA